jgi:hypothetical protein
MSDWLKKKVDFSTVINPFYLYCIAFSLSLLLYLCGWSKLFPALSAGLVLFLIITFILFIIIGRLSTRKSLLIFNPVPLNPKLTDLIFLLIILLGVVNIIYMGFIPVLDRSHNYREFGMPVIDPLFNSLSIFFSVFLFRSFLDTRKKRFLFYFLIILLIQFLIFRRSTITWILTASSILFLLYKRKISLWLIIAFFLTLPLLSYCFGLYGNFRSKLSDSFIMNELGSSSAFKNSGLGHNHYMTFLYIASPLANLQQNIDKRDEAFRGKNFKEFLFYSVIPASFTLRLEKPLNLFPPECFLISPNLIAGSFYMVGFYTLGWSGMIIMALFLIGFILLALLILRKWKTFGLEAYSLLTVAVALLIFSNFLNRLDVILMLFVYPVLFHFIYTRNIKITELIKIREKL